MILYYDAIFHNIPFAYIESKFNRIIIFLEDRSDIFPPYNERYSTSTLGKTRQRITGKYTFQYLENVPPIWQQIDFGGIGIQAVSSSMYGSLKTAVNTIKCA